MEEESLTIRLSYQTKAYITKFDKRGNMSRALRRMVKVVSSIRICDVEQVISVLDKNKSDFTSDQEYIGIRSKLNLLLEFLKKAK